MPLTINIVKGGDRHWRGLYRAVMGSCNAVTLATGSIFREMGTRCDGFVFEERFAPLMTACVVCSFGSCGRWWNEADMSQG